MAHVVPKLGVGGHLPAALRSCPRLGRLDQRPADTPTHVLIDVPAFDVADRGGVAAVGPGAEGRLHEPGKTAAGAFSDEDLIDGAGQILLHLPDLLLLRAIL